MMMINLFLILAACVPLNHGSTIVSVNGFECQWSSSTSNGISIECPGEVDRVTCIVGCVAGASFAIIVGIFVLIIIGIICGGFGLMMGLIAGAFALVIGIIAVLAALLIGLGGLVLVIPFAVLILILGIMIL